MRKVNVRDIKKAVSRLSIKANTHLRKDVEDAIEKALRHENNSGARRILKLLIENARIAKREGLATCQDTGLVVVLVDIGQDVQLVGGQLIKAVNDGVKEGYKKGYFRDSVVEDPVTRSKKSKAVPAVIYTNIVRGKRVSITVAPKGFGSENKSRLIMLNPTDGEKEIKDFVIDTVKKAGPNACPPLVLGVGIGGTFEKAAFLAKKALVRPVNKRNDKPGIKRLEVSLLNDINKLGIGPMGLGGKTTCLSVNILDYPTHIAGLPVAVNVSCHATRSKTVIL